MNLVIQITGQLFVHNNVKSREGLIQYKDKLVALGGTLSSDPRICCSGI